jgi:hypothetical protein
MKLKLSILLAGILFCTKLSAQQSFPYDSEIRAFKHQDSLSFPKPGGILFIGGTSIRLWDELEQRFPGVPIIKRGVGGSELSDLVKYYTPYILFPYKPRKIFIYAGENDVFGGKSIPIVLNEFVQLFSMIRKELPEADVYFLSIKYNPSRITFSPLFDQANQAIKSYLKDKRKGHYLDVNTVLLKPGTSIPDSTMFKSDNLHLNQQGYDQWQKVIAPFIK